MKNIIIGSMLLLTACVSHMGKVDLHSKGGLLYEQDQVTLFNGERLTNYENGKKRISEIYKNGQKYGVTQHWHVNGQLAKTVNYEKGRASGVTTKWYESGNKLSETNLDTGELLVWYESGQKQAKQTRENNVSTLVEWYESGQKESESIEKYINNIQHGTQVFWDENGNKLKTETTVNNKLVN